MENINNTSISSSPIAIKNFKVDLRGLIESGYSLLSETSSVVVVHKKIKEVSMGVFLFSKGATPYSLQPNEVLTLVAEEIGHGSTKKVYKILDAYKIQDGEVVLIDSPLKWALHHYDRLKGCLASFEKETSVMEQLDHPQCISFKEKQIALIQNELHAFVFQEKMEGDLSSLYSNKKFFLTAAQANSIAKQVILGLEYLTNKGFLHPDMKSQNCLYLLDKDQIQIKLSDFENCFLKTNKNGSSGYTLSYASPELVFKFMCQHLEKDRVEEKTIKKIKTLLPKGIDNLQQLNLWGVGILVYETYCKFIKKGQKNLLPWSNSLISINKWAFPKRYPDFQLSLDGLQSEVAKVVSKNREFVNTPKELEGGLNLGKISNGCLQLDPSDRKSFLELRRLLSEETENPFSKLNGLPKPNLPTASLKSRSPEVKNSPLKRSPVTDLEITEKVTPTQQEKPKENVALNIDSSKKRRLNFDEPKK